MRLIPYRIVFAMLLFFPASSNVGAQSQTGAAGYNLPLMIIDTRGQLIERTPRVVVDMGLIDNGEGRLNHIGDERNVYSGKMGINRRGQSSYGFPKRQYRIELIKEDGSTNNVSILGLPAEHDFVLYGPHSDKTLMKNVLTYELFARTGHYAPRTRYVELILDGDYRGIYVLTERLKRDENRVDISKLSSEDNAWPAISGGYMLKRDKTYLSAPEDWWRSPVDQPFHNRMWYEYHHPKYSDLTQEQAAYIRDWMKSFEEMMSGSDFKNPVTGYKAHIDVESFIDMMFINEITKGIDNYNFSSYFYKENDADGGLLVYGPPWDYNIAYGNVNYGLDWHAAETYGWCYTQGGRIYWFERLMEDPEFRNKVYGRWTAFRDDIFSDSNVLSIIDSCVYELGDAIDRNFDKYPILGVWINPALLPVPETYRGEVDMLEDWLLDRLLWMDDQWYGKGREESPADDSKLIHYWHFGDLDGTSLSAVEADFSRNGTATITYPGAGDGYMDSRTHRSGDPVSNINLLGGQKNNQGAVLRVRNPANDRAMIIETPTSGYKDIQLTYATTRTNNGPSHQSIDYSVDGGQTWVILESDYAVPLLPGWGPKVFDLSKIETINNQASLMFKVLFTGENNSGSSGNNRFDNISVKGTPTITTGIDDQPVTANATIMPNPVGDHLTFQLDGDADVQGLLRIFHSSGRLAKELPVSGNTTRIPANDLTPGVYILIFSHQHGSIHKRFIKALSTF